MTKERKDRLTELCRKFRADVLTAISGIGSGHPGGSLSVCEILTLLYQERMNINASAPGDPDRDRLILCKGHAAPMLYRNLIEKGFLPADAMGSLRRIDSLLQGHPSMHTPGIEMPSGPLGIGLSAAQGIAMGLKLNGSKARVFAILGDGELNEGAVWEAATSAPKFELNNLTAVVDRNKIQLDGPTDEIMPLRNLTEKWRSFGWNVLECDGHDLSLLDKAFDAAEKYIYGPTVIIADTVKGRGVSFMEGKSEWHGKAVSAEELDAALKELNAAGGADQCRKQ
ncbi:MAG: transketolase [Oscillospiraceae bacterium]|nr:transketolase [Oscillospiraceae bacterium]